MRGAPSRYDLGRDELAGLLAGEPDYRVGQLYRDLFVHLAEIEECTELPAALRTRLSAAPELAPALRLETERVADGGRTRKWLYRLGDDAVIETVLMDYANRTTVCVSSQAGCAMACSFCATGDGGFTRQLSSGEILEQVVRAARAARQAGRRLSNVVFMGMGEPLANYRPVLEAVRRIIEDIGLGARHLTISTVGVVPGIRRLASEGVQVQLAISLHAGNDALRDELVPLNRRYRIDALVSACRDYREATHRRLSLEWALIAGVNDTDEDALELVAIARELRAHVNLIAWNPTAGGLARGLAGSGPDRVRAFRAVLADRGVNVTVRRTRGREIAAACGQLAGSAGLAAPRSGHGRRSEPARLARRGTVIPTLPSVAARRAPRAEEGT